jgi:CBS domain-containing protein
MAMDRIDRARTGNAWRAYLWNLVLAVRVFGASWMIRSGPRPILRAPRRPFHARITMRVSDIMTPDPITIEGSASLDHALELMDRHEMRHLPVMEDGQLAGILSDRDLLEATGWQHHGQGDPDGEVRKHMRVPVETVKPDIDVNQAAVLMVRAHVGCAPVVDHGRLLGLVSEIDVLRAFARARRHGLFGPEHDPELRAVMTREIVRAGLETTIERARELMRENAIRHLPLELDGRLVAIVSDRDLRRAIGRRLPGATPIGELVQGGVISVPAGARLSEAAQMLDRHRISALLVLDGDRPVGILTTLDVLDHAARMPWRTAVLKPR